MPDNNHVIGQISVDILSITQMDAETAIYQVMDVPISSVLIDPNHLTIMEGEDVVNVNVHRNGIVTNTFPVRVMSVHEYGLSGTNIRKLSFTGKRLIDLEDSATSYTVEPTIARMIRYGSMVAVVWNCVVPKDATSEYTIFMDRIKKIRHLGTVLYLVQDKTTTLDYWYDDKVNGLIPYPMGLITYYTDSKPYKEADYNELKLMVDSIYQTGVNAV